MKDPQYTYLQGLANALDSNFNWLVESLRGNTESTELYDADSKTKAHQLYNMGFTHKTYKGYVRTSVDRIKSMIDDYDACIKPTPPPPASYQP